MLMVGRESSSLSPMLLFAPTPSQPQQSMLQPYLTFGGGHQTTDQMSATMLQHQQQRQPLPMHTEIQAAVNFIAKFLFSKIPRRKVCLFAEQLANFLALKYQGHWHDDNPLRESDFRALIVNVRGESDQVLHISASSIGLELEEILQYLSAELTIWVNPNEVCYRVGERGMFQLIYGIGDNLNNRAAGGGGNQSVGINNPEGWNWIVTQRKAILPDQIGYSSIELVTPSDVKFTVGTFAMTRFGSFKQKTSLMHLKYIQHMAALNSCSQFDQLNLHDH